MITKRFKVYLSSVMLLRNPSEFVPLLAKNHRLLGLDYGSKAIGVAVSDPALRVASPIGTIERKNFAVDALALQSLMRDRAIGGVVMGLPKNLAGGSSPMAQAARAFMRNLIQKKILSDALPILFWDERFSTAAVERFLISDDMTRKRRETVIDKIAAAYILQGVLDAIHHSKNRFV